MRPDSPALPTPAGPSALAGPSGEPRASLTAPPHLARKLYTLVVVHQAPPPPPPPPLPDPADAPSSPSSSPTRRRRVLLGRKLRGFGTGYFNGYGGKVEPGEGVEAAASRELTEEAGIVATDLHRRGILSFWWSDQPGDPAWEVHVFGATSFTGTPVETDEMAPAWFEVEASPAAVTGLPYDRMWADDPLWYPLMVGDLRDGRRLDGDLQPAAAPSHSLSTPAADGTRGPLFMGAFEFRKVTELVGGGVERVAELPALPR